MDPENETSVPNIFSYWGRYLLSQYNSKHEEVLSDVEPEELTPMLGYPTGFSHQVQSMQHVGFSDQLLLGDPTKFPWTRIYPVCIIGAGVAGLYTAMILESLGIGYQIIDANTRKRVGGRLFTHHFPGDEPRDYFDVGAMRYPRTPFMNRTFDLIENRGLKGVKLVPYIREGKNTRQHFNGGNIKQEEINAASVTVKQILQPFRELFKPPQPKKTERSVESDKAAAREKIEVSIEQLANDISAFSMRSWMFAKGIPSRDIYWSETVTSSTGQYDRALLHIVLDDLATNWPTTDPKATENPNDIWKRIDGGSSKLPEAMFNTLPKKLRRAFDFLPKKFPKALLETLPHTISEQVFDSLPDVLSKDVFDSPESPLKTMFNFLPGYMKDTVLFESTVTSIKRVAVGIPGWNKQVFMKVSVSSKSSGEIEIPYSAVISTIPLPRLGLVDLSGANIHDNRLQWSAIRELQSGPAFKIGVRFTTPWWETHHGIRGGQSSTDLPSRTIVYPSHPSKVLIVSYCKAYDAQRFGGLINPDGTADPKLIDQVFRDLAAVHGTNVGYIKGFYKGDYFAWDWARDPLSLGAFGFFGPGMVADGEIYGELLQPAARGKLFLAGESVSTCHGWVAGALNSAWRAVDQYLQASSQSALRKTFHKTWGATEFLDETPKNNFAKKYHELMDRHFVISLGRDGVKPGRVLV